MRSRLDRGYVASRTSQRTASKLSCLHLSLRLDRAEAASEASSAVTSRSGSVASSQDISITGALFVFRFLVRSQTLERASSFSVADMTDRSQAFEQFKNSYRKNMVLF